VSAKVFELPARVRCDRAARELREGVIGVLKEVHRHGGDAAFHRAARDLVARVQCVSPRNPCAGSRRPGRSTASSHRQRRSSASSMPRTRRARSRWQSRNTTSDRPISGGYSRDHTKCPPAASRRRGRSKIVPEKLRPAEPPKGKGPARSQPLPPLYSHLALGDDRRWGLTLADASAARDAEESKHRSRC
jgi:hypothetical protein